MKAVRAGLYVWIPTHDEESMPSQSQAMREYAARRGWTVAIEIRAVGSAASQRESREKLILAARKKEIDAVIVWRLDYWGESLPELLATVRELSTLQVGFVSVVESLDLRSPLGRTMMGILFAFAALVAYIHRTSGSRGEVSFDKQSTDLESEIKRLIDLGQSKTYTLRIWLGVAATLILLFRTDVWWEYPLCWVVLVFTTWPSLHDYFKFTLRRRPMNILWLRRFRQGKDRGRHSGSSNGLFSLSANSLRCRIMTFGSRSLSRFLSSAFWS